MPLQIYPARIGTFIQRPISKSWRVRAPGSKISTRPASLILWMAFYCILIIRVDIIKSSVENDDNRNSVVENDDQRSIISTKYFGTKIHGWGSTTTRLLGGRKCMAELFVTNSIGRSMSHQWMVRKQTNKLMHIYNGNRGRRGRGINLVYWNKGPAYLKNKLLDIRGVVDEHKPHILGLGEANVHHAHDLEDLRLADYSLHLDSSINNHELGIARVAVYTHNALGVKRRDDLEDDVVPAVWLKCGLPGQQGIIVAVGYRQWQLMGQVNNSSGQFRDNLPGGLDF